MLEEAWAPEYTYIGVIVDTKTIQDLQVSLNTISTTCRYIIKNTLPEQLELTLDDIKWAIVAARKLKIKQEVWCASCIALGD